MSDPNEPPPPYPGGPAPYPEKGGPPQPQPGYAPGYAPPGAYAPPPGYPPQQGAGYPPLQTQQQPVGHTTVVINQPPPGTTILHQTFRESPVQTVCPSCQAQIVTSVDFETGTFTYLLCAIICLIGCDLGCCFIPFCVDSCKDVHHICPNCNATVGRWNRL